MMPVMAVRLMRTVGSFGNRRGASRMNRGIARDPRAESKSRSAVSAMVVRKRAQRVTLRMTAGTSARSVRHARAWNDDLFHHIFLH
jgi:hypothetical protein